MAICIHIHTHVHITYGHIKCTSHDKVLPSIISLSLFVSSTPRYVVVFDCAVQDRRYPFILLEYHSGNLISLLLCCNVFSREDALINDPYPTIQSDSWGVNIHDVIHTIVIKIKSITSITLYVFLYLVCLNYTTYTGSVIGFYISKGVSQGYAMLPYILIKCII